MSYTTTFTISQELRQKVQREQDRTGAPMAEILRRALAAYLEESNCDKQPKATKPER